MHDATPFLTPLALCGVALFCLALDWGSQSPKVREARLARIAAAEDVRTLPPTKLGDQAHWLLDHRFARLQGVSILVGLGVIIGLGEGLVWRQRDLQAGRGLRNWTLGVMSVALGIGGVGAALLWPGPWSLSIVGGAGVLWSIATFFLLTSGRPAIA